MSHKGHPACEFNSKSACEKARRIAIGQCSSMLDEMRQCPNLGVDAVDGRGYCGQHLPAIFRAADDTRRARLRREEQDARIDRALAWHRDHPSVWDRMPLEQT